MDSSFPPRASFALLEAAEEALAVLPLQTLVDTRVLKVLPVHGVVEGDDGVWRPHVQDGVVLRGRGADGSLSDSISLILDATGPVTILFLRCGNVTVQLCTDLFGCFTCVSHE